MTVRLDIGDYIYEYRRGNVVDIRCRKILEVGRNIQGSWVLVSGDTWDIKIHESDICVNSRSCWHGYFTSQEAAEGCRYA